MDTAGPSSDISSNFSYNASAISLEQIFDTSSSSAKSSSVSTVYADLNEENLQSHLGQFQLGASWNQSDDSDFEDTSYEIDMKYEIEKQQEIEEERLHQEEINKEREATMKRYFDINKHKMKSIFNLRGMQFTHFNHTFIYFIFTPSAFSKKYICVRRKYYISLKYNKKWWSLKRFQVPNKSEVLDLFVQTIVDDSNIMKVLEKIYYSLVRVAKQQIKDRKIKHQKYLLGQEVYFNCDDEQLLLSPEERKRRTEKINNIWNRMLPPNKKQKQ